MTLENCVPVTMETSGHSDSDGDMWALMGRLQLLGD